MARKLKTPEAVIQELGGVHVVAARFKVGRTAVFNWIGRNKISPKTYCAMQEMLQRKGLRGDPKIWGMREAISA